MHALRGEPGADGKVPAKVLIIRTGANVTLVQHPLLIDPNRGTVEVVQGAVPELNFNAVCGSGRAVYVAAGYRGLQKRESRVLRIDDAGRVRDLGPGPVALSKPALHFDGERLHIVQRARDQLYWEPFVPVKDRWWTDEPSVWWVADADRKELTKVTTGFHRVAAVGTSSHYGLVALLDLHAETALCSVTLELPPKRP
jgi:hypothetical protein